MSVTVQDVERIASLAKVAFTAEEKKRLTTELNSILQHMEQLNKLDTSNVEPLSHVIALSNVFRPDEQTPGVTREEALRNAPANSEKFFKVPKVIGER